MKNFALIALLALSSNLAIAETKYETGTFKIDPAHSSVKFEIPHLVISTVEGKFTKFDGNIEMVKPFEKSSVTATIDAASIDTANKDRDDHLRSPDFFDAKKFKSLDFKSTSVSGKPESFKMKGPLTIHGVTKEVTFDGKYLGQVKDAYGNLKSAFEAKTKINRKEFGLSWGKMVEAGPVVGEEVTLTLRIQGGKKI